jgi:alpha-ketoglutarate-dependent taurine dioxygenase
MNPIPSAPASFAKFKKAVPKAVTLPQEELVKTGFLGEPESMPLVVSPADDDLDLAAWAGDHREQVEAWLARHGALLFRGFGSGSVAEFERFASALCEELFAEYGDLPSEEQGKKVYRSTPYPADKTILFHNESSHLNRWPRKQWFFCVKAARERGETPIVDCRQVYARLDAEVRDRFERQGLLYVRNFLPGLDVSWQDFFRSEDRTAVESYCRRSGIELEWLDGGGLCTRQRCPAVIRHPRTGEKSFFNQVQLHHSWFLEPEVRQALLSAFGEWRLPRNVYYGDGAPIEDAVMQRIGDLYWELAVQFPWREGDVLMVDNLIVAHARNPFVGERKIVVAMGEMMDREAVA